MSDFSFLIEIYNDIFCWLAGKTPGEHTTKGYFQQKDKKVWNKIENKFIELEGKKRLSFVEKEFLNCKYVGPAYRKICYSRRRKGQVYLINCYQSCSKTLNGLDKVNLIGDAVLIELYSHKESYSIDLVNLLKFMYKHNLIQYKDEFDKNFCNINSLERYIDEEEVIVVLSEDNIKNISLMKKDGSTSELEKEQWYRNAIN